MYLFRPLHIDNILKQVAVLPLPVLPTTEITLQRFHSNFILDCVVWVDEPQLVYPKYEKRNNDGLLMMCSLARQRDITLIFSTSDTRWINKGMEAYVDTWVIKNLDFSMVKQGSIIKKIISQKYHNIMPNTFRLKQNEAIMYCPDQLPRPEKVSIELPSFWSESLSKPYKFSTQKTSSIFGNQNDS